MSSVRHRRVPERTVGDETVVARPGDGTALLLAPTAAFVWAALAEWVAITDLERQLATFHPEISRSERMEALEQILTILDNEGLLDRSAP